MRLICLVLACILAGAAGSPLEAQERAWFFAHSSLIQVTVSNTGREWTEDWRLPMLPHAVLDPTIVAGGRYIVWAAYTAWFTASASALVRFDTDTRAIALVPGLSPGRDARLAIDRQTGRLVVLDAAALSLVDVEGLRVVATIPAPAPGDLQERSLVVAGGHAFVGTRGAETGETRVVNLHTGETVAVVPDMWLVRTCRDETRVYLQRTYSTPSPPYAVVEADIWDSGRVQSIGTAVLDRVVHAVGNHVVSEALGNYSVRIRAHDPDTLAPFFEAVAPLPLSPDQTFELKEASPVAPIVMVAQSRDVYTWETRRAIRVFDRATLSVVRDLWQAPFDEVGAKFVMLAPPIAPTGLAADVAGDTVVLTWNSAPDVGDYEISAGLAPGSRNIGSVRTAGAPSLRVAGVPPGTYYVRVRAINQLGGAESSEVRVVVP